MDVITSPPPALPRPQDPHHPHPQLGAQNTNSKTKKLWKWKTVLSTWHTYERKDVYMIEVINTSCCLSLVIRVISGNALILREKAELCKLFVLVVRLCHRRKLIFLAFLLLKLNIKVTKKILGVFWNAFGNTDTILDNQTSGLKIFGCSIYYTAQCKSNSYHYLARVQSGKLSDAILKSTITCFEPL